MFPRSPWSRVIAPLAVFVLVLGVGVAFREPLVAWWARRQPPPAPVAVDTSTLPEDAIERSLRQAAVDSTRKDEWVETVPGIDATLLSAAQRETFIRYANAERCSCGCGFTLAACRAFDPSCEFSLPLVTALFDSVASGLIDDPAGLRERPPAGR